MNFVTPGPEKMEIISSTNQSTISTAISSTEPIIQAIRDAVDETNKTLQEVSEADPNFFTTDNNIFSTIFSETISPSNAETVTEMGDFSSTLLTAPNIETTIKDLVSTSSTTEERSSTFSSIVSDVTNNITDLLTTTTKSDTTDDPYPINEDDNMNDIVVYIIVGLVIALLIVIIIIVYFYCKKCKNRHPKSGDYYVSQYTTNC